MWLFHGGGSNEHFFTPLFALHLVACFFSSGMKYLIAFSLFWRRGGAVAVPVLSLLLPLGAYGALTAAGVDGNKAGACFLLFIA